MTVDNSSRFHQQYFALNAASGYSDAPPSPAASCSRLVQALRTGLSHSRCLGIPLCPAVKVVFLFHVYTIDNLQYHHLQKMNWAYFYAAAGSGATYFTVPSPPFKSTHRVAGPRCTRTNSISLAGGSTRSSIPAMSSSWSWSSLSKPPDLE